MANSFTKQYPNTFSATQQTHEVLKNTDNETQKIYDVLNALNGTQIANAPAGNISATTVQAAINELDTKKAPSNYGLGTGGISFGGDFNAQTTNGWFTAAGLGQANAPTANEYYRLFIIASPDKSWVTQLAFGYGGNGNTGMYERHLSSGTTWSLWAQQPTTNNPVFTGITILGLSPSAAFPTSKINGNQLGFYLDEGSGQLRFPFKLANGTLKTIAINYNTGVTSTY